MKKILILFLGAFCLTGCSQYYFDRFDIDVNFETIEQIQQWIDDNIEYRADYCIEWSSPQRTIERGYGNCIDMSIVMVAIIYDQWGEKTSLYEVHQYSDPILINHIIVNYNGTLYKSGKVGKYTKTNYKFIREYSFECIPMY